MAINPADNPVGALFERYQTSGAPMPEIEVALITPLFDQTDFPLEKNSLQLLSLIITPQVNMVAGQAHAPVFKAKLSVCEGLVVTATGSSKKIAKNLAAAEMMQKDWFLWNIYDGLLLNMQDRQCSIPFPM